MALTFTDRPSPNFGERRDGAPVDMLVLHYTDAPDCETALGWLCDPARQVSAHYLIDEDGTIYRLVDEEKRAWHAGVGCWRGETDINSRSIGIELQNPGHGNGYRGFPAAQMAAVADLCREIAARHGVDARNVVGHSDIAPGRKIDPGELFDWRGLAEAGVGLFPSGGEAATGADLIELLKEIGYDVGSGDVVAAFQRRYRPRGIDNRPDAETRSLAASLLRLAVGDST